MKDPAKPGLPPGGGLRIFTAALLVAGGIGLAIYAFAQRDTAVNHGAKVGVTIVGIALPLFFLAAAYGIVRTVFPPKVRGVTLTPSGADLRRGSAVDIRVECASPDRMAGQLEFGLVCTEFYDVETTDARGNSSRSTRQVDAHTDWRPFTGGPGQTERFVIPADAPYSYRGDCVSYVWRASARLPKRMRFDRAENIPLLVRP
jgi:hypothetical protein